MIPLGLWLLHSRSLVARLGWLESQMWKILILRWVTIAGDVSQDVPAYTNGAGKVLVPVSTSLGMHYRTMRRDSKIERVRRQRKIITLTRQEFGTRKAALYKKSKNAKMYQL